MFIYIHIWPFNTCISRNNTLTEAHNLFKNKTPTEKQQYSLLLESSSMQLYQHKFNSILSGPTKAHDVKNHELSLWKLLSWHKMCNKLLVKIMSIAHKYLTTYHSAGTNSLQKNDHQVQHRSILGPVLCLLYANVFL